MALPRGQVTFVLTDIEGSTALFRELGDRWPPLLDAHFAVLRRTLGKSGSEVKTLGDGMLFAFSEAARAIAACAEAQAALQHRSWPAGVVLHVRMGIHAGEAAPVRGDYVALALHQAARVAGVAHGRQIIVSEAAATAAGRLPPPLRLIDLGEHDLRDFDGPARLFQIAAPGLPHTFPPLRAAPSRRHNLPLRPTSFVGREEDARILQQLLGRSRAVTVCGTGGVGKTRLGLEVAERVAAHHPDGLHLAELAPAHDERHVVTIVARAVGLTDPADGAATGLAEAVGARRALLILDNCEQADEAVARVASALLRKCPELRLLLTSRWPLGFDGEVVHRLAPLTRGAARELFQARARSAGAQLEALADTALVDAVCAPLEGLPLALELVAARLRVMPLPALAAGLGTGIQRLAVGGAGRSERQRTLAATIEWSYGLLGGPEKVALRRVSLFPAPFTPAAAGALGGPEVEPALWVLADRSLITVSETGPDLRFAMLEPIREFARERLERHLEAPAVRCAALAWAIDVAEPAAEDIDGPARRAALHIFGVDAVNLAAPLEWADGDAVDRLRLATALSAYELVTLRPATVRDRLEATLAGAPSAPALLAARARHRLARAVALTGDAPRAVALLQDVASRLDAHDAPGLLAEVLGELAYRHHLTGRREEEPDRLLSQARALARESGPSARCRVLFYMSQVASADGDLGRTVSLLEEAVATARPHRLEGDLLLGLANLAHALLLSGDPERAHAAAMEALALCDPQADRWARRHLSFVLGGASAAQGNLAEAHRHLAELVPPVLAEVTPLMAAAGLENLALVWARAGVAEPAALALGAAERFRQRIKRPPGWDEEQILRAARRQIAQRLDDVEFDRLRVAGAALGDGEVSALVAEVGERLPADLTPGRPPADSS